MIFSSIAKTNHSERACLNFTLTDFVMPLYILTLDRHIILKQTFVFYNIFFKDEINTMYIQLETELILTVIGFGLLAGKLICKSF